MEFVAVRDFRIRPGLVWKRLKKSRNLVITSQGKPIAMLRNIEGRDIEEELKIEAQARAIAAVSQMRQVAAQKGLSTMAMEEIDREIAAARKARG
jgi:antitoxin (DNA-binding transcriptional repressor) of toxin-antitoxin stability system